MSNIISEIKLVNGAVFPITAEMIAQDVLKYITDFYSKSNQYMPKRTVLAALDELKKNVEENFYTNEEIAEKLADEMENPIKKENTVTIEKSEEVLTQEQNEKYYADWIVEYYKKHPEAKKEMEARYFNTSVRPVKDILTKLNNVAGE